LVRQDKITFLISTLESPEFYSSFLTNEFVHHNKFFVTSCIDRILKRVGILNRLEQNQTEVLTEYVPVNKHKFLKNALIEFSKDYCLESSPLCQECSLKLICDYYNKKNDWLK